MDKIKARNVINHDYISCLALVLWLGHLRESQNLRGVDCSMLFIEGNSKIGIE